MISITREIAAPVSAGFFKLFIHIMSEKAIEWIKAAGVRAIKTVAQCYYRNCGRYG